MNIQTNLRVPRLISLLGKNKNILITADFILIPKTLFEIGSIQLG
jgi:hypothetical protein